MTVSNLSDRVNGSRLESARKKADHDLSVFLGNWKESGIITINEVCPALVWMNSLEFHAIQFQDEIIQRFIYSRIKKVRLEIMGSGGFNKEELKDVSTADLPCSYEDFKETLYSESSLIFVEASQSYDPGKGRSFLSWLWYKLADLLPRFWRLSAKLGQSKNSLSQYIDIGQDNRSEFADIEFRESLTAYGRSLLATIETGIGFKIKKSDANKNVSCHMGARNFWESFIRDQHVTFNDFMIGWNELRQEVRSIESGHGTIYTITEKTA